MVWTKVISFADRDMYCHFSGIGVGHEIQYQMQATPNISDESDEGVELNSTCWDDEDDCASFNGCSVEDINAGQASDGWELDENGEEDEFKTEPEYEDEEDEFDLENDGNMSDSDEDVRFWCTDFV